MEQSLCLVRVHWILMVPRVGQWVGLEDKYFETIVQVVLMQVGLGWVAWWEVGLG